MIPLSIWAALFLTLAGGYLAVHTGVAWHRGDHYFEVGRLGVVAGLFLFGALAAVAIGARA